MHCEKVKNTICILLLLLWGFLTNCQKSPKSDIKNFNDFLGKEKAKAFNEAIKSFDKFLETNFPNQDNQSDKTKKFLKQFLNSDSPDSSWIFRTKRNKKILEQLESSGLRKEIWIYGKENYDEKYNIYDLINPFKNDSSQSLGKVEIIEDEIIPIPRPAIDSTELARLEKERDEQYNNLLMTNEKGEILYGLAKFANNDSIVQKYVEVKLIAGDISPSLVASAFLSQIKDFENPFIKRMIFVELYYWIMKWDVEKNNN